jgi:hypothetical protein
MAMWLVGWLFAEGQSLILGDLAGNGWGLGATHRPEVEGEGHGMGSIADARDDEASERDGPERDTPSSIAHPFRVQEAALCGAPLERDGPMAVLLDEGR